MHLRDVFWMKPKNQRQSKCKNTCKTVQTLFLINHEFPFPTFSACFCIKFPFSSFSSIKKSRYLATILNSSVPFNINNLMKPLLLLLLLLTHTYADTIRLNPGPCKLGCKNIDYVRGNNGVGGSSSSGQSQSQMQTQSGLNGQSGQNIVAVTVAASSSGSEASA